MKTKVVLLVGESGSGKTTLEKELMSRGFHCIESYTTREPRYEGERGHIFASVSDFNWTTDIVAQTAFDNNYYWTTREQFNREGIIIYTVDIQGVKDCINNLPIDTEVYTVYLKTSTITRLNRMTNQDRSYEDVIRRLKHDELVFKYKDTMEFDRVIDANRDLDFVLMDMMQFLRGIV